MAVYPVKLLAERFWAHIDKGSDCWLWRGSLMYQGYGEAFLGGSKWRAHRLSWVLAHGPIPEKQQVLHHCDVRNCVNPKHLFLGTDGDNIRDMMAKGRMALRSLENNGMAKLTADNVRFIREERRRPNPMSFDRLAVRFCVSKRAVIFANSGRNWASLDKAAGD